MDLRLTKGTLLSIVTELTDNTGVFPSPVPYVLPFAGITDRGVLTTLADVDFGPYPLDQAQEFGLWSPAYTARDGSGIVWGSDYFAGMDLGTGLALDPFPTMTIQGLALGDANPFTVLLGFIPLPEAFSLTQLAFFNFATLYLRADSRARWGHVKIVGPGAV